MFVVKAKFVELYSNGGPDPSVEERITFGQFPVYDAGNIDSLVRTIAGRHDCVGIGLEHLPGSELKMEDDKD